MKKLVILAVVVSVLLFSGLAGWYVWSQRPAQKIIGTWGSVISLDYEFRPDGTFTQYFDNRGGVPASGRYRFREDGSLELELSRDQIDRVIAEAGWPRVDVRTRKPVADSFLVRRVTVRFKSDEGGDGMIFVYDENHQDSFVRKKPS